LLKSWSFGQLPLNHMRCVFMHQSRIVCQLEFYFNYVGSVIKKLQEAVWWEYCLVTSDRCYMQQKGIVPLQRSLSCELQYKLYICALSKFPSPIATSIVVVSSYSGLKGWHNVKPCQYVYLATQMTKEMVKITNFLLQCIHFIMNKCQASSDFVWDLMSERETLG